jgi:integrase
VKDIFFDEGTYRFNPTVEYGLKNADARHSKRPLLFANEPVRHWLERHHPSREHPNFGDRYVITGKPENGKANPTNPVGNNCLRYVLSTLKENAGIDKPLNPHSLRHNFVTLCKRDYDMDTETVKWLIGHSADSSVLETTYSHLSETEYQNKAEARTGLRDESSMSSLTPTRCHCGEPISESAKACAECGAVFTPDAHYVERLRKHARNPESKFQSIVRAL